MLTTLPKNLHLCFTKPLTPDSSPPQESQNHMKNFNSLYDHTPESTTSKSTTISRTSDDFSTSESEPESTTPDFATILTSQRFFFSSPGRSNSIIESSTSSSSTTSSSESDNNSTLVGGGVPLSTYSPDPYKDFRRSMQEMVESRKCSDVTNDWDFLHELLLCYLALNPKHAHKYILSAFADLLISLVKTQDDDQDCRNSDTSDTVSFRQV